MKSFLFALTGISCWLFVFLACGSTCCSQENDFQLSTRNRTAWELPDKRRIDTLYFRGKRLIAEVRTVWQGETDDAERILTRTVFLYNPQSDNRQIDSTLSWILDGTKPNLITLRGSKTDRGKWTETIVADLNRDGRLDLIVIAPRTAWTEFFQIDNKALEIRPADATSWREARNQKPEEWIADLARQSQTTENAPLVLKPVSIAAPQHADDARVSEKPHPASDQTDSRQIREIEFTRRGNRIQTVRTEYRDQQPVARDYRLYDNQNHLTVVWRISAGPTALTASPRARPIELRDWNHDHRPDLLTLTTLNPTGNWSDEFFLLDPTWNARPIDGESWARVDQNPDEGRERLYSTFSSRFDHESRNPRE